MEKKVKYKPLLLPASHSPPESILVAGRTGDGKTQTLALMARLAAYMGQNSMLISCSNHENMFKIYQRIPFSHQYIKESSGSSFRSAHIPKFYNIRYGDGFDDILVKILVQIELEYSIDVIFIDDLSSVKAGNLFGSDIRLNFNRLVLILQESLFKQNISLVISRNCNRSVTAKDISQFDYSSAHGGNAVCSLFQKVIFCSLPVQDRCSIFPNICIKYFQDDYSALINLNCI